MALVPFKNLLQFLQKKCSKHLKIDQKDLSRVAKFVSHDGNTKTINYYLSSFVRQFGIMNVLSIVGQRLSVSYL